MKEHQNIEFKETWRDEYIKWICGFANAQGGTLIIGKNDSGASVGISNSKKLLEDIPNKIRDILGIVVDVNLITENGKDHLEIVVEPYPYPVNYKGEYHYRSGSTKQVLKGAALDKFLLQKQGKHWDGVPVPQIAVSDFKDSAFELFRNMASKSDRISKEVLGESNELLIENLHLKEGNYLKRAAILLFHHDPEKFVSGSYIKVGFFKTDDDLVYQDEIHGNLLEQADKTLDILLSKYLRAHIRYEGINRIEKYPIPKAALREALLNAIVHKDYSSGIPVQISIYDNKIVVWNDGQLPENWTIESLQKKHPSKPYNPLIANAFFRAGLIESWGRGIQKINSECKLAGVPNPEYHYDFSGVMLNFKWESEPVSGEMSGEMSGEILKSIQNSPKITIPELAQIFDVTDRTIERYLRKLRKENKIERVGSTKSGSWKII